MAERPPAYALLHIQPAQFHRYSEYTEGVNEKLKKTIYVTQILSKPKDDTSGFRGKAYDRIAFKISRTSLRKSVYICNSVDCNKNNLN